MGTTRIDAVVVGAGQSGLSLSHHLQERDVDHVVLEKERPFAAWFGRWDSLCMNTPNWMNVLPGGPPQFAPGASPTAFGTRADALDYFDECLKAIRPPLVTGAGVDRIRMLGNGNWLVETAEPTADDYECRSVGVCTGVYQSKKLPSTANQLPEGVQQIHSSEYRRASDLHGRVALVVGSGSSGVQICEELATSGRFSETHLAVSGNRTIPFSLLGIPVHSVLSLLGVLDMRRESWLGSRLYRSLNETGDAATPPTPRQLAKRCGVELVGHLESYSDDRIGFSDGQTLATQQLSIVWCTGFRRDYDHIEVPDRPATFDEHGPIHERGIVPSAPGLCFVGLRFQHTVSSHLIYGVGRDAARVAEHIAARLGRRQ